MKRVYFLLLLLLNACAPVSAETQDLYTDAQQARATADAAQDLAEYQERFLTATAEAPIVHITETAAGLIVVQTADALTKTAIADSWTPTPSPTVTISPTPTQNATSTIVFALVHAEGTQIANNVERDTLDLEKKRISNEFWARVSGLTWAFFALVGVLLLMVAVRQKRYQPAQVDACGNVLPMLDLLEGTITDVDSNPNYRSDTRENMIKQWLRLRLKLPPPMPEITAERQDAVKQRDQLTDMATRGLPNDPTQRERKKLAGQEAMKQLGAPKLNEKYIVFGDDNIPVIDAQTIEILDRDWKEAQTK